MNLYREMDKFDKQDDLRKLPILIRPSDDDDRTLDEQSHPNGL
jgi:hypothetical protein